MSDYLFMLESLLSAEQNCALAQVQEVAGAAGVNLFLTGGGMRDMLGGFRIRDLDFSVEGPALKLAKALEERGARVTFIDENRRIAELVFPDGVTAQIGMSRQERYTKSGGKPQVTASSIHDDLRGRDFTVNAMALSLNRASRGLFLDPTNGLADLGRREMRSTHPYVFYDDPVRLLRLTRLCVRMAFTVEERTRMQYENALAANMQDLIPPRARLEELKRIAAEPAPLEILQALDKDGLLALYSPAISGAKLNSQGLARLEKAAHTVAAANIEPAPPVPAFLVALTAKLTPKERVGLIKSIELPKADLERMRNLEPRAKKLEQALKSARVKKPSHVYLILADAPADEIVFLLANSAQRSVQERIRNYLQKYRPTMLEVPQAEWEKVQGQPGTPKHSRSRQAFVASHLDVRPRKPAEVPPPEPAPPVEAILKGRIR